MVPGLASRWCVRRDRNNAHVVRIENALGLGICFDKRSRNQHVADGFRHTHDLNSANNIGTNDISDSC